jgi:hypothetical protein
LIQHLTYPAIKSVDWSLPNWSHKLIDNIISDHIKRIPVQFKQKHFCVTLYLFQFVAGGIVLLTVSLSVGMMFGFSAILLPQLEDENIMAAKSEEASWIGKKPKFRGLITWSKISSLKVIKLIENYQWHHDHHAESAIESLRPK